MPTPRVVIGADPASVPSSQLEAGVFATTDGAGGSVDVKVDLPYIYLMNTDSVAHSITLVPRAQIGVARSKPVISLGAGATQPLPTLMFGSIVDGGANGTVFWFYSDVYLGPSPAAGGGAASVALGPESASAAATSGSITMFGLGSTFKFTPKKTGILLVMMTGYVQVAGVGQADLLTTIEAFYGTGSAPANGAAQTGTEFSGTIDVGANLAAGTVTAQDYPFSLAIVIPGPLTIGTAYWFDLGGGVFAGAGGVQPEQIICSIVELGQ